MIFAHFEAWRWMRKLPSKCGSYLRLAGLSIFTVVAIRGIFESVGALYIHGFIGDCYPTILAMTISFGGILFSNTDESSKSNINLNELIQAE